MIEKLPYAAGGILCASFLMPLATHDATNHPAVEMFHMESRSLASIDTVLELFPKTPTAITQQAEDAIRLAKLTMQQLYAIPAEQRTFANTIQALDDLGLALGVTSSTLHALEILSPDKSIRDTAHEELKRLSACQVDLFGQRALYDAIAGYAQHGMPREQLNPAQTYAIQETLKDLKRSGLCLPEEQLAQVRALNKQLSDLGMDFSREIADDNKTIAVAPDDLDGASQGLKQQLQKDEQGNYLLTTAYPVYFDIMDNCHVAKTRKELSILFNNRGYPANDARLRQIVALRDQLAHLLGFESYAALDIDGTMAGSVTRVHTFLDSIARKACDKAVQEIDTFLPFVPNVQKDPTTGKLSSYDSRYLIEQYRKTALQLDDQIIKEYFPVNHALDGMLDVYQKLLGLRFVRSKPSWSWHPDVELVTIYDAKTDALRGYLFLDLYPRDNKYSHACCSKIVPARLITNTDGSSGYSPSVVVVVANFPKATAEQPALFRFDDVNTFFHEFGHAMHCVLGATELAGQSGYDVKFDFVEMPSQMFEEWLYEPEVLAMLSHHYKTGETLPNDLIQKLRDHKKTDSGLMMSRQCWLSFYSLLLYAPGEHKDPKALMHELSDQYLPHIQASPESHFYASFGHLTGYAARYYGYLWSRVYAIDLFATIKQRGLLDPMVGKELVDKVLGKGGSCDPDQMLQDFLGRAPSQEAFLKAYGMDSSSMQ